MTNKKCANSTSIPASGSPRPPMPIIDDPNSTAECPIGVCNLIADLIEDAVQKDAEIEALKTRLALIEKWWQVLINDVDRYIEQRQSGKDS